MTWLFNAITTPCAPLLTLFIKKPTQPLSEKLGLLVEEKEKSIADIQVTIEAIDNVMRIERAKLANPKLTAAGKRKITNNLKNLLQSRKKAVISLERKEALQQNLSDVADAHSNLKDAAEDLTVMKQAQRELSHVSKRFNPDDVARIQEEIQDSINVSNEVTDLISSPFQSSSSYSINESTFDAEIDEILGEQATAVYTTPSPFTSSEPVAYPLNPLPISIPARPSTSSYVGPLPN